MRPTRTFARPTRTFAPREMAKLEAKISALRKKPRFAKGRTSQYGDHLYRKY